MQNGDRKTNPTTLKDRGPGEEEKTLVSGFGHPSKQLEKKESSESLSRNLSLELLQLMKDVTRTEVSAETVNAACNCASQIHKILRLNLDMKKAGF